MGVCGCHGVRCGFAVGSFACFNSILGAGAGVDSSAGGGNRSNGGTVVVVAVGVGAFGGSVRTHFGWMQPSVGISLKTALEPLRRLAVPPLPMRGGD